MARQTQERTLIKYELFADAFIKLRNATKACIIAGYSAKTARQKGYELLRKPEVKEIIEQHKQKILDEDIASEKEILQTYTRILRGEEYEEVATANGTYITAPSLKDRIKSGEMIGKSRGMWTDKKEISVSQRPKIIDDIDEDEEEEESESDG